MPFNKTPVGGERVKSSKRTTGKRQLSRQSTTENSVPPLQPVSTGGPGLERPSTKRSGKTSAVAKVESVAAKSAAAPSKITAITSQTAGTTAESPPRTTRSTTVRRPETTKRPVATKEQIAIRAYHIWEQEGRPSGRHLQHWMRAIEELSQAPC